MHALPEQKAVREQFGKLLGRDLNKVEFYGILSQLAAARGPTFTATGQSKSPAPTIRAHATQDGLVRLDGHVDRGSAIELMCWLMDVFSIEFHEKTSSS